MRSTLSARQRRRTACDDARPYWLTANLAACGPLLIVVDDAHWADGPSRRRLAHLAVRIGGLPVAACDGPDQPAVLDELRASPGCAPLRLRASGTRAIAALVRDRLSDTRARHCARRATPAPAASPFLLE